MQIVSSYTVRIAESTPKIARVFIDTLELKHWGSTFVKEMPEQKQIKAMEQLCIRTRNRPDTPYDFSEKFYKFPSYLRRGAIRHAYGKVSSYMTRLETWTQTGMAILPGFLGPDASFLPCIRRTCLCVTRKAACTVRVSRCLSAIRGTG